MQNRRPILKIFEFTGASSHERVNCTPDTVPEKYAHTLAMLRACDSMGGSATSSFAKLRGVGELYVWHDGDVYLMLEAGYFKTLEGETK